MELTTTLRAIKEHRYYRSIRNLLLLFVYFAVGCGAYSKLEGWSIGTTISFTLVTFTTVGYGYITPSTDSSRLFTIFYIVFGVCFIFAIVSEFVQFQLNRANEIIARKMKSDEVGADYQNNRRLVIWNILAIGLTVLIGGAVLMSMEGWSFIQGVYFALETSTTIGYGDLDLKDGYTHIFMAFYILFSTALFAFALNNVTMLREKEKQLRKLEKMMLMRKNLHFLEELDKGEGLTKEQFIMALLIYFGTLDEEKDIKPWADKFHALDRLHRGKIFRNDISEFTAVEAQNASAEIDTLESHLAILPAGFYEAAMRASGLSISSRPSNVVFADRPSQSSHNPFLDDESKTAPLLPKRENITDNI